MAEKKKQSFMVGAVILTASTLLVKLLSLLFTVPLMNLISPEAMSSFHVAYNIFSIFLMLSTAGLPIAVSRMVGTAYSQNRLREADRFFSVAFWLFFGIGLAGFLVMFFGADWLAELIGYPHANHAIMALAPTLFFISVTSALRGYFQGRSNMVPTAASQSLEALVKVAVGVGLAVYILRVSGSDHWAAVGAIIGVSVSSGLSVLFLLACKVRQQKKDGAERAPEDGQVISSRQEMLWGLIRFSIPLTIGSCFLTLLDSVDTAILSHRLQDALLYTESQAETLNGLLGNARKFFDLPGAFVIPISTSLLPVLSGAIANDDRKSIDHISSVSLRVTLLISIPASVGMCIFASPICQLLLSGNQETAAGTAPILAVLSLGIAFNSTLYTTNTILQSFGRTTTPVVNMAIGGLVRLALSYVLIGIPQLNVMGAAISSTLSYLLIMVLNFLSIRKNLNNVGPIVRTSVPMIFSSLIMGVVSYGFYRLLVLVVSPRLAVLPAIAVAVVVYALCAVSFRAVTYEDVILLPKGETLARLLRMKKTDPAAAESEEES